MIRPEIIIKAYNPDGMALKEVQAGIEEEGVLYKIIHEERSDSAASLGQIASEMSQIEVGIGIHMNQMTLYTKKIKNAPLFTTTRSYRQLGQNAARYVKANPLIEI